MRWASPYLQIQHINDTIGYGVFATSDIGPATEIAEYGGQIVTSAKVLRQLTAAGNGYLLKIPFQKKWLNGQTSTLVAPKVNHACDCSSNCEWSWNGLRAVLVSKASEAGRIKQGAELTIIYNFTGPLLTLANDPHMKWYVNYVMQHKRVKPKCKLCKY